MRLLLLRHGQTHGNIAGALDTAAPGADLSDLGHRQAAAAARALQRRTVTGLYVSNLVRTQQTALPIGLDQTVTEQTLVGIREISAGDHEMATHHEAVEAYIGTVAAWLEGDLGVRMPGGETGKEFLDRFDAAVEQVMGDGHDRALLVSHGAAMRTWVSTRALNATEYSDIVTPLQNTACIEVELTPRGWEVVSWEAEPVGAAYLLDDGPVDRGRSDPDPAIEASTVDGG